MTLRLLQILGLALASLPACSSSDCSSAVAPAPECTAGEIRCDGDLLATCTLDAQGKASFGASVSCEGDGVCKAGACVDPTDKQRAQAAGLGSMVAYIKDNTAWPGPVDWAQLTDRGTKAIYRGDGSDSAYFGALFDAFIAVPEGHQGLYLKEGCGSLVPLSSYAQRGACGQPHAKGIVVTNVVPGNILGLKKGDLITAVGDAKGRELLARLADRPLCATSRPGNSYRDASTAATFADLLRPAETFEIEDLTGTRRTVTVPDKPLTGNFQNGLICQDPFGRARGVAVEASVRPDGVAVIRLPGFTDASVPFPENPTIAEFEAYRETFEAKIQTAFDGVKTARAIVWDVRGNPGGLTQVGLDIVSGFPGARADLLSYCNARKPKSDPPSYDTSAYAAYALVPGGRFTYPGKVAILTDGNNYSAADYFALATKARTNALLVGAQPAGGFGATSGTKDFAGPLAFSVSVDANHCISADDKLPLEGHGAMPHVVVDYEPADLALGKDTVLERAVQELDSK